MAQYALIHKAILSHPLFDGEPYSYREAWLWIILNVTRDKTEFRCGREVFPITRGAIGTRYRALAREWKWSVNKVRRYIAMLQDCSMIDTKTEHGFVMIRVCNFDKYQSPTKYSGTQAEQKMNKNGTKTEHEFFVIGDCNLEQNHGAAKVNGTRTEHRRNTDGYQIDKVLDITSKEAASAKAAFWGSCRDYLGASKMSLVGKWVKEHGEAKVFDAVCRAQASNPAEPIGFITRLLTPEKKAYDWTKH